MADGYTKIGAKVRYHGNGGYAADRERLESFGVRVGDKLTVQTVTVEKSIAYFKFEGIEGVYRDVMFNEVS